MYIFNTFEDVFIFELVPGACVKGRSLSQLDQLRQYAKENGPTESWTPWIRPRSPPSIRFWTPYALFGAPCGYNRSRNVHYTIIWENTLSFATKMFLVWSRELQIRIEIDWIRFSGKKWIRPVKIRTLYSSCFQYLMTQYLTSHHCSLEFLKRCCGYEDLESESDRCKNRISDQDLQLWFKPYSAAGLPRAILV